MSRFQLFKKIPEREFLLEILQLYGLNGFDTDYCFTREMLKNGSVVDNLNTRMDRLKEYYLPCKAKVYLNNLNEKRSITVLRQLLKPEGYKVVSKERYHNGKKYLEYHLFNTNEPANMTISFD